jgi:para-nitrobenzyl esterase
MLARKGAVVVTYNYRLGVFGFLAHSDLAKESSHHTSGNYALIDMQAALRWVQKNIESFGDDPQRVTIDGESAGAIMVAAMVGSPEGKGLFKRAAAQSGGRMGTSIARMTTRERAEAAGMKLAQSLNANSIAELRTKPADELVKARGVRRSWLTAGTFPKTFRRVSRRRRRMMWIFLSGQITMREHSLRAAR